MSGLVKISHETSQSQQTALMATTDENYSTEQKRGNIKQKNEHSNVKT